MLHPRTLAFIGGAAAELAIDGCRSLGFEDRIWGVNPRRRLKGAATVASAADLPVAVDAALVAVPRDAAVSVVRDLADLGAGAAVCHTSGFAEHDLDGAARQRELVDAAAGMPLVGPNCIGVLSAVAGAALWPDVHGLSRCERGVAFISQSGNIAVNFTMQCRGLDVAYVVTLGNQADVGVAETLEAMVADEAVTAVGLYVEAVDDIGRFAAAAVGAKRRGLPVVALKSGTSDASRAIAVTHTASITGSDAAYDAFFRRVGVRRVRSVGELLDTLAVIGVVGPLPGARLVSLSCSGGEAALVADRSGRYSVTFPAFAPLHRDSVAASLDGRASVSNPLDYHTFIWGDEPRLTECFSTVLEGVFGGGPGDGAGGGPGGCDAGSGTSGTSGGCRPFDAAMLVLDFPRAGLNRSHWFCTLSAFAAACSGSGTPGVVVSTMAECLDPGMRAEATGLGLAACSGIDNALSALEAAVWFGRPWIEPLALMPPPAAASSAATTRYRGLDRATLSECSEHEAKRRLADAGVTVPSGRLVPAEGAVPAAAEIGYPVVVKAVGLTHKTDAAGVEVGLTYAADVACAAARLGALGDGSVLVEACVVDAVAELLVSVRAEPPVGMLLTLGAGGTLVELLSNTVSLLLSVRRREVLRALRRLRVWPMMAGHRGRPPAAVGAVLDTVGSLESLVRSQPRITEIEINPLLVTPARAVAVDALIVAAAGPGEVK